MKVYIVTDSWHDNIEGVFDTFEKALAYAKKSHYIKDDEEPEEEYEEYIYYTDTVKVEWWEVE